MVFTLINNMRQYLPPEKLTLTVTKPIFEQLSDIDHNSFLYKSLWKILRKAREKQKET